MPPLGLVQNINFASSDAIDVPVNITPPERSGSGDEYVGEELTVTDGVWEDSPTITYQWFNGDGDIDGATGSSYILTVNDANSQVGCRVTATNVYGGKKSLNTDTYLTKELGLSNITQPVASTLGDDVAPADLATTDGTWDSNPPNPSFSYQWYGPSGELGTSNNQNAIDVGSYYCVVSAQANYVGSVAVLSYTNNINVIDTPVTPFAPTDIAGCQLWLKGDGSAYNTGSTQATDGQTVETWIDNSGQGNHSIQLTGIRRPVFKDILGVKSLLTAGAEWMDTTWSAGSTCSIFVVYKNSGTSNGRWVSGGNNWLLGPYSFNYSYYSNAGFAGGSTPSNGNTLIRLHNAVQTSGGGQHWLNGVSQGTVGSAGAPGIISAPGTYLSGGELGSGHIYEVIGYDSALSESDRQLVENYLLTKYGI